MTKNRDFPKKIVKKYKKNLQLYLWKMQLREAKPSKSVFDRQAIF